MAGGNLRLAGGNLRLAKRNIRLTVAFDGSAYHGWQIQKSAPTVQGLIAETIFRITHERVSVAGSGRTDAGTHARGLVANFLTESRMSTKEMVRAFNGLLPRDVRILSAREAQPDFHARRDAVSKVYRYQIYLGPILMPHLRREFFHFPYSVDVSKMQRMAKLFVGKRDFASFTKKASVTTNTVRRIIRCDLKKDGHKLLLTVAGTGFLHHMVRNMAGTLLEVGRGTISQKDFRDLFVKRDRTLAGFTAPAHGLVLLKVQY